MVAWFFFDFLSLYFVIFESRIQDFGVLELVLPLSNLTSLESILIFTNFLYFIEDEYQNNVSTVFV